MARVAAKTIVKCLVDGKETEMTYAEACQLRDANLEAAKQAGETTFDGVIICDKCGTTKKTIQRRCHHCKVRKEKGNRANKSSESEQKKEKKRNE
ncbi:hypothetical protein [Vibrio hannami]|uniref:hypothetical protein n=1 Tax=Vibrio hannami TaxID=2717094 RepID=UPI003EB6DB41